jgi:copper transport protein
MALSLSVLPVPRGAVAGAVWARFGRLAALSVAILLASGVYSAGRQVGSLENLLGSTYGHALLAKAGLMVLMAAVGLFSAANPPQPKTRLLAVESGLGLLALLAVGVMVASPPGRAASVGGRVPATLSQSVGDLLVAFDVKPNQPGTNLISLRVASTRRPAPAPIGHILVRFVGPPAADVSGWIEAESVGRDNLFQVGSEALTQAGAWRAEVLIQRPGLVDTQTTLAWNLGAGVPGYAGKE